MKQGPNWTLLWSDGDQFIWVNESTLKLEAMWTVTPKHLRDMRDALRG